MAREKNRFTSSDWEFDSEESSTMPFLFPSSCSVFNYPASEECRDLPPECIPKKKKDQPDSSWSV